LIFARHGSPLEVLALDDPPRRPLARSEIRVEVLAAPINPMDLLTIRGFYPLIPTLPAVPGSEGVARVVECGDDANAPLLGKRILLPIRSGSWARQAIVNADQTIVLPPAAQASLHDFAAATLRVNPPSAEIMLGLAGELMPGSWVIHSPGAGSVGQCIVELAKRKGLRTLSLVRDEKRASFLAELGTDAIIECNGASTKKDVQARVREICRGEPIALALDGSGGETSEVLASVLSPGSSLVVYGAMSRHSPQVAIADLVFRGIVVRGFWLFDWVAQHGEARLREILDELAIAPLRTRVEATYPLERFREALEHAQDPMRTGRILFTPNVA
jgi:NADPH:quinone reductase-like Zn-dependent oxidoreductase